MTNRTRSKPASMVLDPHETVPLCAGEEVHNGTL